jgi:Mrp family chromosome partitioning ATPase
LLRDECGNPTSKTLNEIRREFPYLVLSAGIGDADLQVFCRACEAAVLVITANITRREAALKAKEELVRCGVNLLGAILDQRKFPIPESLYRRL